MLRAPDADPRPQPHLHSPRGPTQLEPSHTPPTSPSGPCGEKASQDASTLSAPGLCSPHTRQLPLDLTASCSQGGGLDGGSKPSGKSRTLATPSASHSLTHRTQPIFNIKTHRAPSPSEPTPQPHTSMSRTWEESLDLQQARSLLGTQRKNSSHQTCWGEQTGQGSPRSHQPSLGSQQVAGRPPVDIYLGA